MAISILMITDGNNLDEIQDTEFKRTIIKVVKELKENMKKKLL